MIIIYGKPADNECPQCGAARMLCEMRSIPYESRLIGQDTQPGELTLMAGVPIRSAPAIFERDAGGMLRYIGGYQELREHTKRPTTPQA